MRNKAARAAFNIVSVSRCAIFCPQQCPQVHLSSVNSTSPLSQAAATAGKHNYVHIINGTLDCAFQ